MGSLCPHPASSRSWDRRLRGAGKEGRDRREDCPLETNTALAIVQDIEKWVFEHLPFCYLPGTTGCSKAHSSTSLWRMREGGPFLLCSTVRVQGLSLNVRRKVSDFSSHKGAPRAKENFPIKNNVFLLGTFQAVKDEMEKLSGSVVWVGAGECVGTSL